MKTAYLMMIVSFIAVLVLAGFVAIMVSFSEGNKSQNEMYKEWCPKLRAKLVEPVEGYVYNPRCFIEQNNVVTFYYITEVNGQKMLREDVPNN